MKKKRLAILFVAIMTLGLSACNNDKQAAKNTEAPIKTTSDATVTKEVTQTPVPTETPKPTTVPYNAEEVTVLKKSVIEGTVKENIFMSKGNEFQMEVPKGWQVSNDKEDFHLSKGKTDAKDRVKIDVSEKDLAFEENEQSAFEEYYSTLVEDLEFLAFEHTTIANLPAIKMIFKCKSKGEDVEMTHYQYLIDGKCTYNVSFVEVESDMEQSVEKCIKTIQINEK